MDPELRTYLDDQRRHFDVVAEAMRSQVQLVAEGVGTLGSRLDRLEENLREEILRSQREFSAMIRFRMQSLNEGFRGWKRGITNWKSEFEG